MNHRPVYCVRNQYEPDNMRHIWIFTKGPHTTQLVLSDREARMGGPVYTELAYMELACMEAREFREAGLDPFGNVMGL